MHTFKMLNIFLIEIKDCIWEKAKCKYNRVKGEDNIRGPQLERDHKNLSREYELIKPGPEQYPFKDPQIPSYGPAWYMTL